MSAPDRETPPDLCLLPIRTTFDRQKRTARVAVAGLPQPPRFSFLSVNDPIRGYEIHMGRSMALGPGESLFRIIERNGAPCDEEEGMGSSSGPVWGCYLHGLFENDSLRRAFLNYFHDKKNKPASISQGEVRHQEIKEAALDRLEAVLREHLDWKKLDDLL